MGRASGTLYRPASPPDLWSGGGFSPFTRRRRYGMISTIPHFSGGAVWWRYTEKED